MQASDNMTFRNLTHPNIKSNQANHIDKVIIRQNMTATVPSEQWHCRLVSENSIKHEKTHFKQF